MSKVSSAFGELISSFLDENKLTFRAAGLRTSVSAAYWKDMSDGRVPSEDILARIAGAFDELDENKLRVAAGYGPKLDGLGAAEAVGVVLRGQDNIPEEGKRQILDFVKEIEQRYKKSRKR